MIRTSTVVYIVLLLVLAGVSVYLNNRQQPADIELTVEPTAEIAYVFNAEDGTPARIRIEANSGEIVEVARDADNAWTLVEPAEAPAEQGAAEAAASQVTTMRILDTVPDVDPGIVGLDEPGYVLTVEFTGAGERTVEIGVITPTESGYYVRDPEGQIVIVSRSAVDALLGLLTNPPYLETPTAAPMTPEEGTPSNETATP